MKHLGYSSAILASLTGVVLTQASVWAAPTPITAVNVNQEANGLNITLTTGTGDRPEVFTLTRDNAFVVDIVNTQLRLPGNTTFLQMNPAPGLTSIEVTPIDTNSVRLIVRGSTNVAPTGQVVQGQGQGIVLNVGTGPVATTPTQTTPPTNVTPPNNTGSNSGEVMVPNPSITISRPSQPPLPSEIQPPLNQSPPFFNRAVAPPLGDIAVSNIDASPNAINLGTAQRIPRLVLREAPVREVLSLLARTAGINIAFADDGSAGGTSTPPGGAPGTTPTSTSASLGIKISLDIENESVQDVFNYVLRLSGLQANRIGRTIFVGTQLPVATQNVIVRTLRLNQVGADSAAIFLAGQGAEVQQLFIGETTEVRQVALQQGAGGSTDRPVTVKKDPPKLVPLSAETKPGIPRLLQGLAVSTDGRLNSITLIGEPRKVDLAIAFLTQLDLRRRQVAINVKIIDVNLSGTLDYNASFSFGVNDTFFVNDGGAASLNFGGVRPPTQTQVNNSLTSPPTVLNPLSVEDPFFDPNAPLVTTPLTAPGAGGLGLQPISPVTTNPNQVGLSDYKPFVRSTTDGKLQSLGETTYAMFPLFQYPTRFLAALQAQIQSRNAKVLTDPTLVVQEGEAANVNLTQDVITNVIQNVTGTTGATTTTTTYEKGKAGLILGVKVDRIDDNGFISMKLSPTVASIGRTQTVAQGLLISLLQQRSLESGQIRMRDGQTLIVSGIISDGERTEVSKVPILGDLPLIGSLFRKTNKINERAEVVVLVTPQILNDNDRSSWGYQYKVSPDAQQMLQRGLPLQQR